MFFAHPLALEAFVRSFLCVCVHLWVRVQSGARLDPLWYVLSGGFVKGQRLSLRTTKTGPQLPPRPHAGSHEGSFSFSRSTAFLLECVWVKPDYEKYKPMGSDHIRADVWCLTKAGEHSWWRGRVRRVTEHRRSQKWRAAFWWIWLFLTVSCDGRGLDFMSFPLGHVCEHHLTLIAGDIMEVLWR